MSHIHKTRNRLLRYFGLSVIVVFGVISTLGTGGGGGGGNGGLTYKGNIDPAIVTVNNAPTLVANVLYGGTSSSNIPTGVSISSGETRSGSVVVISDRLLTAFHYSLDNIIGSTSGGYYIPAAFVVDELIYCESGYYTLKGTLNDSTGTGTLKFNFVNCLMEGTTYDGGGSFRIDSLITDLDATMSFTLLTISSAEYNGRMSGKMRLQESISGNTATGIMTMNYVAEDNDSGKMYKFDNLVMTSIVDDIYLLDSSGSRTFTGSPARVYDSNYGYVIIDTPTPLLYSSITLANPDNGGVMTFTGEINSSIKLTVMSGRHVMFELDIDGDTVIDEIRYLLMEELAVNASTDLTDTDGDGMHDSWETTYGLDPNTDDSALDLDSDTFSNLTEYQSGTNPNDAASLP